MVLILAYLPWLIVALTLAVVYKLARKPEVKKRGQKIAAAIALGIFSFLAFNAVSHSYIPNGVPKDTLQITESFEVKEIPVQDVLLKPDTVKNQEKLDEKLDWKAQIEKNKEIKNKK